MSEKNSLRERVGMARREGQDSRRAAVLEFLYLNQEWDALETTRQFAMLSDGDREQALRFLRRVNETEGATIVASEDGLTMMAKATSKR